MNGIYFPVKSTRPHGMSEEKEPVWWFPNCASRPMGLQGSSGVQAAAKRRCRASVAQESLLSSTQIYLHHFMWDVHYFNKKKNAASLKGVIAGRGYWLPSLAHVVGLLFWQVTWYSQTQSSPLFQNTPLKWAQVFLIFTTHTGIGKARGVLERQPTSKRALWCLSRERAWSWGLIYETVLSYWDFSVMLGHMYFESFEVYFERSWEGYFVYHSWGIWWILPWKVFTVWPAVF